MTPKTRENIFTLKCSYKIVILKMSVYERIVENILSVNFKAILITDDFYIKLPIFIKQRTPILL